MKVLLLAVLLLPGCSFIEHEPPVPAGSRLFFPSVNAGPDGSSRSAGFNPDHGVDNAPIGSFDKRN